MERQTVTQNQKSPARLAHVQRNAAGAGPARLIGLQSAIGNQAMCRLIDSPFIQTKLEVSTPEDPQEQEADDVADTVMRTPEPAPIQRIRLSGSEEEGEQVSDATDVFVES